MPCLTPEKSARKRLKEAIFSHFTIAVGLKYFAIMRLIAMAIARSSAAGGPMAVKEAFVLGYGVIDETRQVSMGKSDWQDIRSQLNSISSSTSAYCLGCNEPVFLRAAKSQKRKPHFSHFEGGGQTCPWGPDATRSLDKVRAGIFDGNQESEVHRRMCELVVELAAADERYVAGTGAVDKYARPTDGRSGRWPDASFELQGLGKFAVEVQFAPSLAPEVSGRSDFYAKEGINLIWLLPWYSFEQVTRAFAADIAQEAQGNFFVLDREAELASRAHRKLMIWVAWHVDGELTKRLVALDDLNYRQGRHPYFVDMVTQALFLAADERRNAISRDLMNNKTYTYPRPHLIFDQERQPDDDDESMIRAALSIWSAAKGAYLNHAGKHDKLTSQVDAYLNSAGGRRRANLVNLMLISTRARGHINSSVWQKIGKSVPDEQLDESDHWISYVYSLFPEVFRTDLRGQALFDACMPDWAMPDSITEVVS